ncbi:MAG: hypothetical protein ACKV2T_43505 [Kofleriaceae bacterium]
MKLTFVPPDGWLTVVTPELTMHSLAGTSVRIEVLPLIPLPDDRRAWGENILRRHMPANGSVQQVHIADATTELGWPLTLVTTVLRDAAGVPVEGQLAAVFELLYYGGVIVCRTEPADAAKWEELRPEIFRRLGEVVPDFTTDEVERIDSLYDMTGAPTPRPA